MYNYPAGQYGQQPPGYAPYPGMPVGPPGIGPPGAAGAPGVAPPPGVPSPSTAIQPNPGLPPRPNFQNAPPNINFSAPIIRLGTSQSSRDASMAGRSQTLDPLGMRRGLGASTDGQRPQRDQPLVAPTREEVMRTIFIGKIPSSVTDSDLERILAAVGSLRRWARAVDADNKPCTFGFAEYEDAESLETAAEVLQGVEVPSEKVMPNSHHVQSEHPDHGPRRAKLLVQVDDASRKYAEEWRERRNEDESASQFRIDSARDTLDSVLTDLFHPSAPSAAMDTHALTERDMQPDPLTGEIITIPLTVEDELSDIPPEMRDTVAAEIAAFRDRSNRRDLERLRREEEMEAAERKNARASRLASPPATAPTGPAGGANGIPVGPRDSVVRGAPSGPKGFLSSSGHANGTGAVSTYFTPEEEASDLGDEELAQRRREKQTADEEKRYLDYERKWLNRERARTAAIDREKARDDDELAISTKEKEAMEKRLKEWDDDAEQSRRTDEFYRDRSQWLRNRAGFRGREKDMDERDRAAEDRELARDGDRYGRGSGQLRPGAPSRDTGHGPPSAPQRVKISLGAAMQRVQAAAPRRTVAEVEDLLGDDDDDEPTTKRTLVPLQIEANSGAARLSEEERQQAVKQLAQDIPSDKERLWAWKVEWEYVDENVIREQIRPFVEKKMVEYLGVLEEMLVDVVIDHIKKRGTPEDLIGDLEGPLDEEAEVLVKKLWRMIIFCSESEKRGLST